MMQKQPYSENFFKSQRDGSRSSAQVIIPMLIDLIQPPRVIDIGCGVGGWLAAFSEAGITRIRGVDGSYVNRELLFFPEEFFTEHDLREPYHDSQQYDLAISLEVGEHLPAEKADTLVDTLTGLAPVVLFSAAIPYTAGVNQLNDQWQDYWAEKFQQRGYLAVDYIRKEVWNNPAVAFWYAQNMLLYVREDYLQSHPPLLREHEKTSLNQLNILHPQMLTDMGLTRWFMLVKRLPFTVNRLIKKRFIGRKV